MKNLKWIKEKERIIRKLKLISEINFNKKLNNKNE